MSETVSSKFHSKGRQILVAFVATLNALPCGMQFGWSAPVIPILLSPTTPVKITKADEKWLESAYMISGMVAIPITVYLVDKIGRKNSILLSSTVTLISWIVIGVDNRVEYLYLGRILSGIASDMAFVAVPMYISEIASSDIRGFLVGFNYLMMLLGVLVVYSVAPFTPYFVPSVVGGVVTLVQLVVFPFMPSSPYYLMSKSKWEEGSVALRRLRDGGDTKEELDAIAEAVKRQNQEKGGLVELLVTNGRAVGIVAGLVFCQHFSGYTVVVMNMHTILTKADSIYLSSEFTGIISSGLMLGAATVSTLMVDKFGRRYLLVVSGLLTGLCLAAVAVYFSLQAADVDLKRVSWIPVVSLMAYAVTFKLGVGFLPQVINSELFPNKSKAMGMTLGDAMFLVFSTLSILFYEYVVEVTRRMDVSLYVFAVVAFVSVAFTVWKVPETKGKTLEEIQMMLKRREN